MSKTYTCCHAPNTDLAIHIYDRSNQLLADPMALMSRASNLKFSKIVSSGGIGGYSKCSFGLPIPMAQKVLLRGAQQVEVRCGRSTAWAGRIEDMVRTTKGGGDLQITAIGVLKHLNEIRITEAAAAGETATGVLQRCLQNAPLIDPDFERWEATGFDIGGISWTRKTIREIAEKALEMGDTTNREIMLNVWKRGSLPITGSFVDDVAASKKDAYRLSDGGDQSYTSSTVRCGSTGVVTYCAGLIFPALGVPRYTNILSCTARLYAKGEIGADEPSHHHLYFEKSANPADFDASWPDARTKTSEFVNWQPANWPAGDEWITTPDLTVPLQEVVNSAGFSPSSQICLLLQGVGQAGKDFRKQFEAFDDATAAHNAEITITHGASPGMRFVFKTELISRLAATPANVDYVVYPGDVTSGMQITETLGEMENEVAAEYGAGSVTSYSEDAASVALYDARYNDPSQLNAGDAATLAQAQQLRATRLALHKDPKWRAGSLTVRKLRNRWGQPVNLALVEPRCIIDLRIMPKMQADDNGRPLFVLATEYNHSTGTLTLSPDVPADLLALLMVRMKKQLEA